MAPAPLLAQPQAGEGGAQEGPPPVEAGPRQGWEGMLALGANFNLVQSQNLVGQTDGFNMLVGGAAAGQVAYVNGPHEVRGALLANLAWARTPLADNFIKTNDVVLAELLYQALAFGGTGPAVNLGVLTHLLPAEDVRPFQAPYLISRPDGGLDPRLSNRLELSPGLSPFTLTQSVGWAVRPLALPALTLNLRLGASARETLVREGTFVVVDKRETPEIEILEIASVLQGGLEAVAGARGALEQGRLTYEVNAGALLPLFTSRPEPLPAPRQTRWLLDARVNVALLGWLTLSYQHLTVYDPALLDAVQMQNNLMLRLQLNWQAR